MIPATGAPEATRRPLLFYGWWIVIATFILAFVYSGFYFYAFTLFVTPIKEELPRVGDQIVWAFFVAGITGATLAPVLGWFFDRRGPKLVVSGGMVLGALGFVVMGVMSEPWHMFIGLTLASMGPIAIWAGGIPSVVNWFARLRGRALGMTMVGLGLGGVLTSPSLALMDAVGWRNAFLVMAAIILILLLPLSLVLRRRPEDYGLRTDGDAPEVVAEDEDAAPPIPEEGLTFSQIVRAPTFWMLASILFLAFWPIGALQVHQAPFMEAVGYTRGAAAFTVGAMAVITIVGRLGGGWLADTFDPRKSTVVALALQGIGIGAFALSAPQAPWLMGLFLVTFAPGFGAITVLQSALLATYFGRRSFGAAQGVLWTVTSMAFSLAPMMIAASVSIAGQMRWGFGLFAVLSIMASVLVYLLLPKPGIVPVPGTPTSPSEETVDPDVITAA